MRGRARQADDAGRPAVVVVRRSFCGSSSCDGATPAGGSLLARSDGMRSFESERGDGSRCSETTEEVAGRSASPSEAQQGAQALFATRRVSVILQLSFACGFSHKRPDHA
eukprot:2306550-Pleurochrysis_carterae.AAC.1